MGRRPGAFAVALAFLAQPALAATLAPRDTAAMMEAAGYVAKGGKYLACDGQQPLGVDARDINGDGRMDAVITDYGLECFGSTETGFTLMSKDAGGRWKQIYSSPGIPNFLKTASQGWPDIEVGGPGFCFPVLRWNGATYAQDGTEYEGKPCQP
jgi:hypothetical protein